MVSNLFSNAAIAGMEYDEERLEVLENFYRPEETVVYADLLLYTEPRYDLTEQTARLAAILCKKGDHLVLDTPESCVAYIGHLRSLLARLEKTLRSIVVATTRPEYYDMPGVEMISL